MPKVTPEGLEVRAALLRSLLTYGALADDCDKLELLVDWEERTALKLRTRH